MISHLIKISITACLMMIGLNTNAQFTANAGKNITICKGDSVLLGGTPIAAGGMLPYNYTWTPNYNITNASIDHPKAWPDSTITYTLTVGDGNGRSAIDSIKITVIQKPLVTLDSIPDQCTGYGPLLLNQGKPTGGYYIGTSIVDSLRFDPAVGIGTYTVTYHYKDKFCSYADSATQNIRVFRSPIVRAGTIPDSVCLGDSVRLTAVGAENYNWGGDFNFKLIKGDSVIMAFPDSSGVIGLSGTNYPYCKDTIAIFIKVVDCSVGISQTNQNSGFVISPNPAKTFINIHFNEAVSDETIDVLDINGKILNSFLYKGNNAVIQIDVQDLNSGVYFLHFHKSAISHRFIKMDQ